MSDLRKKLIRLAHAKPELRKDLLPLLKQANESEVVVQVWSIGHPLSLLPKRQQKAWGVDIFKEIKRSMGSVPIDGGALKLIKVKKVGDLFDKQPMFDLVYTAPHGVSDLFPYLDDAVKNTLLRNLKRQREEYDYAGNLIVQKITIDGEVDYKYW